MNIPQEKNGLFSPFLKNQRFIHASKYIKSNSKMLDIGCGSGEFEQYLKEKIASIDYYGVDIRKFWSSDKKNLFVANILEDVPKEIKSQKFDYITALALIEHLSNPELLIVRSIKLLKEGGALIITTPHPIGRKIHDFGAKIGLFSSGASEEHEKFLDISDFNTFADNNNMKVKLYNRFLFGFNQIVIMRF